MGPMRHREGPDEGHDGNEQEHARPRDCETSSPPRQRDGLHGRARRAGAAAARPCRPGRWPRPVKSRLTSPTQTEEVKAASFIAPADAKIRVE